MSEKSSANAEKYLIDLGVHVIKGKRVGRCDGAFVYMNDGSKIPAAKVIWAAGIICPKIAGLPEHVYGHNNRIKVNQNLQIPSQPEIYVLGDAALVEGDPQYQRGHPQVAQVAIQMATYLAKTWKRKTDHPSPFVYKDLGSMATIGRNRAVVDLPSFRFGGFFAWIIWLLVHLYSLLGVRNKVIVFINWVWNYFTYDQSLRLIINPRKHKQDPT
jgi:NADH dehydrogenase